MHAPCMMHVLWSRARHAFDNAPVYDCALKAFDYAGQALRKPVQPRHGEGGLNRQVGQLVHHAAPPLEEG